MIVRVCRHPVRRLPPKSASIPLGRAQLGHQNMGRHALLLNSAGGSVLKWITRERPKIDRIACPWLIARFIDRQPEFLYVPSDQVLSIAKRESATPYDVSGAELSHVGNLCSFDAFLSEYQLKDDALRLLAVIVRGADTGHPQLTPQSAGLLAISHGLSAVFADDHEMLRYGLVMYDALYAWCRQQVSNDTREQHS
jgi:hypothetical protein